MSREKVLSLLRERQGDYLSGEAMSRELGISRAGVWKAIEGLRQEGYTISSAPNRGYRLEAGPDRLRAGELSGPLSGSLVGGSLLCLDVIDSTNTELQASAMAGAAEGLDSDGGGTDRRPGPQGPLFPVAPGEGAVSLRLAAAPAGSPPRWLILPPGWPVAVCDGIQAACGLRPQIKWTNDIILNGKKLVGILTELGLVSESNDLDYLVTGIGVNVNQSAGDFDPEIPGYGHFFGPDSGAAGTPVGAGGSDYPGPGPSLCRFSAKPGRIFGEVQGRLHHHWQAGPGHHAHLPARGIRRCGGRRL